MKRNTEIEFFGCL